jgi:hypothetical protein
MKKKKNKNKNKKGSLITSQSPAEARQRVENEAKEHISVVQQVADSSQSSKAETRPSPQRESDHMKLPERNLKVNKPNNLKMPFSLSLSLSLSPAKNQ